MEKNSAERLASPRLKAGMKEFDHVTRRIRFTGDRTRSAG